MGNRRLSQANRKEEMSQPNMSEAVAAAAIEVEEIAEKIKVIADASEKLMESGLSFGALVLLVQDRTSPKLNRADIAATLRALPLLKEHLR